MHEMLTTPENRSRAAKSRLSPPISHHAYFLLRELRKLLESISKDLDGEMLLDFGSGDTPYRQLFESRVGRYVGADLEANPVAAAVINPDGTLAVEDESFDVVLSTQVLEHVLDPMKYLAEARRVLRPKGELILSTHGYWRYHPHPTDYWRWTASGLRKIVEESGFQIVEFHGIMGPFSTALQLMQDAIYPRLPRGLRAVLIASMQSAITIHEYMSSRRVRDGNDSCVYLLTATKPSGSEE